MCDFLSLSVLQILSLLSFLTSVLAVLCVGTGSLHRLSHRLDKFEAESGAQTVAVDAWKASLWNWSMSSSLGALLGEEDMTPSLSSAYTGGAELTRMNWQTSRSRSGPHIYDVKSQPPVSMAKIIMSRHSQRRNIRLPRRLPGSPRPTPPSRLMESAV